MNMQKPVENLVFDFLTNAIEAAPADSILHKLELHDTMYQTIKKDLGVKIGNAESTLSPLGSGTLKEFDAVLELICYSRVLTSEKRMRLQARNKVFHLAGEITNLFFESPSMNETVCDVTVIATTRAYDDLDGNAYAIASIPIVVNSSGSIDFSRRN